MTRQLPWIQALLVVSSLCVPSWGWGLGGDEGRARGTVRPLGVVGAVGDSQAGLLTIHGHHLLPVEGEVVVRLAGEVLEVVSATPEEIQALLPAGLLPGTYLLQVLAGPEGSWAAPVTVGEVADGAPPEPVEVSLLRIREAHADLVAGTLLIRGESLGTSPDTTPTVTLSDVPLFVESANEVEVLARLPGGLRRTGFAASGGDTPLPASSTLQPGTYRVRVVRTAPGGTASIWTDAMDVTTVSGGGTGDITAVNTPAGGGLQGGVASGDANLGLVGCYSGQVLKADGAMWSCAEDADTGINEVEGGSGVSGSILLRTLTLGSTATPTNAAGAIVARDDWGSFAAGSIRVAGNLDLPKTTSAFVGVLTQGGGELLHSFGEANIFLGRLAGNFSLTGWSNTAVGDWALNATTTGGGNVAFGNYALIANTTGINNSAFGHSALSHNTTGESNTALGPEALGLLSSGNSNTAIGYMAGMSLVTGSDNIYIGNQGVADESATIRIGASNSHGYTYIAGISGSASPGGIAVFVNSSGKLGTTISSRRYKEQIADMNAESDVLLKLRPVSFYYRPELDETHLRQYGLVAEEVAEVAPDLVAYDEDGTPQAVRYHFVNAMLLNEVQKQRRLVEEQRVLVEAERRANEEQKTTIGRQASKIEDLEARLARLEAALAGDR